MTDPKQSPAKVVLNATAYKEISDGRIEISTPTSIDITDLLEQNNVFPSSIYGVSTSTEKEGEFGEAVTYTNFVVREADIRQMIDKIYGVIDAAIVNTNQGSAVKNLIEDILNSFLDKCWGKIHR